MKFVRSLFTEALFLSSTTVANRRNLLSPAVQAETLDQIIEVLKSLKYITEKGELDVLLTQAGELIRKRFKPKK